MRKYTELEELMCLGCHPYESQYIDRDTTTLYICNSFAYKLWNASSVEELEQPTRKFDNCGFKISDYLAGNSSITKRKYKNSYRNINRIKYWRGISVYID